MCGIFFSLSTSAPVYPNEETCTLLQARGPDSFQSYIVRRDARTRTSKSGSEEDSGLAEHHLTFLSTVLSLRGDHVYAQPLVDATSQAVLCWNGEAWKIDGQPVHGNDTEQVFRLLLDAVKPDSDSANPSDPAGRKESAQRLADVVSSISGPFSFVFYDAFHARVYFSRDCLGRRSLLQRLDGEGNLKICSLCDGTLSTHFEEVSTGGVHVIELDPRDHADGHERMELTPTVLEHPTYTITTIPWAVESTSPPAHIRLITPIPLMNKSLPEGKIPGLSLSSPFVSELERRLRQSLELRLQNIPTPPRLAGHADTRKVAILFSGGLDCTLLARLSHEILPEEETIDLLNVAFENPRVAAAAAATGTKGTATISIYESCPDRITGRGAFSELQNVCPNRNWRFVAVDVPYMETLAHRDRIKRLMRPHNTEMDLSIACALYFASRGQGMATDGRETPDTCRPYTTPSRVLLSGLGADELFAGYTRHAVAYARDGFRGLVDEIDLDVSRLGQRNLGRDDRVISHWSREARYPYLDEEFVAWVVRAPVWQKCGFGWESTSTSRGPGQNSSSDDDSRPSTDLIEPGKKTLRLVAARLGMVNVAREKKRAIQFGSRTAKMEKGKTKGTDSLS